MEYHWSIAQTTHLVCILNLPINAAIMAFLYIINSNIQDSYSLCNCIICLPSLNFEIYNNNKNCSLAYLDIESSSTNLLQSDVMNCCKLITPFYI